MNKFFKASKSYIVFAAVTVAVFTIAVWNKAVSYVQSGLSDSQSIRVSEKATCDESQQAEGKFTGCNSIL
jgi:hypothetical protein